MKPIYTSLVAALAISASSMASAETLRLLTWGSYAPDNLVKMFEEKYPDIDVEVTFSNNEEMIAKLRATGGAGFDLAQPSHDRIFAAQLEYDIYKPLDLSKIDTSNMEAKLLDGVKANTTIDGDVAYSDLDKYQGILDKVADKLISCKENIKAYWKGGDDLSALMLSGEIVASETWDSTAYKLYAENEDIVFVPPSTGALAWIDTFALPRKGKADDAAYKWINFVLETENVKLMSESTGAIAAVKGAKDLLPDDKKAAVNAAFTDADVENLKFFANIPPGVEDMEGKTLEKIKAATGG